MWLRAAYFATGVVLLIWLSIEDATLQTPLVLAAWLAGLIVLRLWVRFRASPCQRIWWRYPLIGIFIGVLIPLMAVFMTIFKSSLHAHGFLEFTAHQLISVLRLTPALALSGLALGTGVSLWARWVCEAAN